MAKKEWHPEFTPSYTPKEMLEKGVFEGKYVNDIKEVPGDWKKTAKVLTKDQSPDPNVNFYKVKSRQPLSEWKKKGWIDPEDPEGWFSWYIKYFLGRRIEKIDEKQIKRWKSFVARHQGQINANCTLKDDKCRPVQRQGLLQWAWDSHTEFNDTQREKNLKRIVNKAGATLSKGNEAYPLSDKW